MQYFVGRPADQQTMLCFVLQHSAINQMIEKYPDLVVTSDPYTGYRDDSPSQTLHLQKDSDLEITAYNKKYSSF